MSDTTEIEDPQYQEDGTETTQEIPLSLREFGEIPANYVSAFIQIKKTSLNHVAKYGFRTLDNQMMKNALESERIFQQEATRLGIKFDRSKSIFAYPMRPDEMVESLGFDPKEDMLLEVKVDPKKCLVADAGYVGAIYDNLRSEIKTREEADRENARLAEAGVQHRVQSGEESAGRNAKKYWETAMFFDEYIRRGWNKPFNSEEHVFEAPGFPEVLISENIPTNFIRAISDYVPSDRWDDF